MPDITPVHPEFGKPPVIEVAIGLVFDPLLKLHPVALGAWWNQIQDEYVTIEQQPPIITRHETFPGDPPPLPLRAEMFFPLGGSPRYWLVNKHKDRVLQVQQDRFTTNWRRMDANDAYPEYGKSLRTEFESRWGQFLDFLHQREIGEPKITLCEVTYVNKLTDAPPSEWAKQLPEMISPWRGDFSEELPPLEGVAIHAGFLIPDVKGRVQLMIGPNPDGSVLQLTTFARIRPDPQADAKNIIKTLDLAHDWAVHSFLACTTPAVQKSWIRKS